MDCSIAESPTNRGQNRETLCDVENFFDSATFRQPARRGQGDPRFVFDLRKGEPRPGHRAVRAFLETSMMKRRCPPRGCCGHLSQGADRPDRICGRIPLNRLDRYFVANVINAAARPRDRAIARAVTTVGDATFPFRSDTCPLGLERRDRQHEDRYVMTSN